MKQFAGLLAIAKKMRWARLRFLVSPGFW